MLNSGEPQFDARRRACRALFAITLANTYIHSSIDEGHEGESMPWGNQNGGNGNSGGPWHSGPGPWGQGAGGGGPPADMERMLRGGQDRLNNLFKHGGFNGFTVGIFLLAGIAIWLLTGFYT